MGIPLQIRQIERDGQTVFFLRGELTAIDAIRLSMRIEAQCFDGMSQRVVVDMSYVSYIESTAVGSLIYCYNVLKKGGKELVVAATSDRARMLFGNFPLEKVLSIVEPVCPTMPE